MMDETMKKGIKLLAGQPLGIMDTGTKFSKLDPLFTLTPAPPTLPTLRSNTNTGNFK